MITQGNTYFEETGHLLLKAIEESLTTFIEQL